MGPVGQCVDMDDQDAADLYGHGDWGWGPGGDGYRPGDGGGCHERADELDVDYWRVWGGGGDRDRAGERGCREERGWGC